MTLAMRSNGLHHAISLGQIEVASKEAGPGHFDRYYDSDDENMSRHRLRTSSSSELYPRTPIYSKGDIREQYCLTDRQLNSIERPRRESFFGCLSRRSAPQSFLGVCVGRRPPSDENLAAYVPFYKYPRYQQHHPQDDKAVESEVESSYFRRQPASILSTAKMSDTTAGNRHSWTETHATSTGLEDANRTGSQSVFGYAAPRNYQPPPLSGANTPRTKHVSFARSHTLTSFNDANLGLSSSGRINVLSKDERLIGGKKPMAASGPAFEPIRIIPTALNSQPGGNEFQQAALHQAHIHGHQHGHNHSHSHHHGPQIHVHQLVPIYRPELDDQLGSRHALVDGVLDATGVSIPLQPPSPEIVVVEKKFRNAMKTQATQTELRKERLSHSIEMSPSLVHKVKVVSQGAQTNGLLSGKKLRKSLSEMPSDMHENEVNPDFGAQKSLLGMHEVLYRTHSEEPPRSSQERSSVYVDNQTSVMYYTPPTAPECNYNPGIATVARRNNRTPSIDSNQSYSLDDKIPANSSTQSIVTHSDNKYGEFQQTMVSNEDNSAYSANCEDSCALSSFDYESNSLPRRACSYHRLDKGLYSSSLPRKDPLHAHEICRHITDCAELLGESSIADYPRQHLLQPPRQYRKTDEQVSLGLQKLTETPPIVCSSRRMSMVVSANANDTPFKRDDIRRQSMPVAATSEKLVDEYSNVVVRKLAPIKRGESEEKEIFIDFKPHTSPSHIMRRHQMQALPKSKPADRILEPPQDQQEDGMSIASPDDASIGERETESDEEHQQIEEPLYENVSCYNFVPYECDKKTQLRKRSISLEDTEEKGKGCTLTKSDPPSPCQEEMLVNTSTYPSSDSLANDLTRDHSDGIWNESQVTVLTADTRSQNEPNDLDHVSTHLLTPSAKRKNLILQHQQRSSIDTEALDLEDQLTDNSPTYSIFPVKTPCSPIHLAMPQKNREFATAMPATSSSIAMPTIAVTPTASATNVFDVSSPRKSADSSRRSSKSLSPVMQDFSKSEQQLPIGLQQKNLNNNAYFRAEAGKANTNNTDVSECSTNTDEYATCTDTSKRTPGIKTPPTITSSSSTTQVPVSGQSSQTEKTQGGSSFESASSLYSTRGDTLFDDIPHPEENLVKERRDSGLRPADSTTHLPKRSPSHSISSTSSGSYNISGLRLRSPLKTSGEEIAQATSVTATSPMMRTTGTSMALDCVSASERDKLRNKTESISDDDRSDMRYSSSGYYESPREEEQTTAHKLRRHRLEDDRKRRRTTMKLDIEKENLRALTSPVKKFETSTNILQRENSPEQNLSVTGIDAATSPSKIKRFRPKVRRHFKRASRDECTARRQKNIIAGAASEVLLDNSLVETAPHSAEVDGVTPGGLHGASPITSTKILQGQNTASVDSSLLKAKSIESLRSVSPGSDSVFYSEADGTAGDQHSHCLHCGKEMEASSAEVGVAAVDSVESLPCIDLEQDIVKPPSDFADSPVTTKATQRLYKKMDKRFRSEERYNTERGRHYKNRQDNIRAKSEERNREKVIRSPLPLRPAGSSPSVLPDVSADQKSQVIYRGHYDQGRYCRLTDTDVWTQLDHQSFDRQRERRASTESEKSFHTKYQVILHRLVQRRCTLEMYHRQKSNTFKLISSNSSADSVRRKLEEVLKLMLLLWAREGQVLSKIAREKHGIDKTVVVKSDSGEFGFRIHGSKPVVVAAIEPDTPAESSGLEVGDIIISVNGVQVLDKHHTEVVKIAHAGCDTLALEVARTIGVLMNEQQERPSQPILQGYLWRQSGQARGAPNAKKWVRRWFCLRPDHCLYYYKTDEDSQPVGAMIMAKHTVEPCSQDSGKPFAFKIDSGEGIPMFVAADSEELAAKWMAVLKHSAVQTDPWLEKCARALHQPPSGIVRPDCFGYLMKLGSRWCGWSKRYCVLKDACLYFYQDANSKSAFGMACLQGYKVASMPTNASGRKNSFEIIPQEPKLRHYYFSTECEMDKKRWISALEYSIDRWIKSG